MTLLHQTAREGAFRARLLVGLAALGATLGVLGWLHYYITGLGVELDAGGYMRTAARVLLDPSARAAGLHLEMLAAAAAGAAALALPGLALLLKSQKSQKSQPGA